MSLAEQMKERSEGGPRGPGLHPTSSEASPPNLPNSAKGSFVLFCQLLRLKAIMTVSPVCSSPAASFYPDYHRSLLTSLVASPFPSFGLFPTKQMVKERSGLPLTTLQSPPPLPCSQSEVFTVANKAPLRLLSLPLFLLFCSHIPLLLLSSWLIPLPLHTGLCFTSNLLGCDAGVFCTVISSA